MATRQSRGPDDLAGEPRSIELRDYAQVVRQRWRIVLTAMLLGAALALAYSVHKPPVYAATSEVFVEPVTQGPLNPAAQPNLQVNMATEQAVAESAPVATLAAHLMHSPVSASSAQAALSPHLTVNVPVLSNVMQITWQGGSPQAAQQGANAFAKAYLTYRHNLLLSQITRLTATLSSQATALQRHIKSVSAELGNTVAGTVAHQTADAKLSELNGELTKVNDTLASLPTYNVTGGNVIAAPRPVKPAGLSRKLLLVLGALLGLLAGVVVAFVRDALDDRLHDPAALERKLGVPTLGILTGAQSRAGRWHRSMAITTIARRDSADAEAFRALRATLTAVVAGRDLSTIAVVGVDGSVSSSQVAAELSLALAESGRRTLLIAADIRHSTLAQTFAQPNVSGLTNILVGRADPAPLTLHPKLAGGEEMPPAVASRLALIVNGQPLAEPLSVLDSVDMARFLRSIRREYDFVVLDAAPADAAAEFLALARLVDGVVAVATQGYTRGRAAEDMRQRLDRIDGFLIGGVLIERSHIFGVRRRFERAGTQLTSGTFAGRRPDEAIAPGSGSAAPEPQSIPPSVPEQHDLAREEPQRATRPQ